jgi:hypothetical protein
MKLGESSVEPNADKKRRPWVVPAAVDALEPQDIANSYLTHQDINPHAVNDFNKSGS